jgi:hypothetical protein
VNKKIEDKQRKRENTLQILKENQSKNFQENAIKSQKFNQKIINYQTNAENSLRNTFQANEWKSKIKGLRFLDMEENKKHIYRALLRKSNELLSKHRASESRIRQSRKTEQQFIKDKMYMNHQSARCGISST